MTDRLVEGIRDATEPSPEAVQRIRMRVLRKVTGRSSSRVLLTSLPDADSAAHARVLARVRELALRRRNRTRPWHVAATGLAAAAAVGLAMWWLQPHPPADPLNLESEHAWNHVRIHDGVQARYQGRGSVAGGFGDPLITWHAGTLELEVDPDRGTNLTVRTREASVTVVGTMLTVERDALGTGIDVWHGRVEVTCAASEIQRVAPGQHVQCVPTSAAGLLGRARALAEAGAPPSEVLEALDAGLSAGPQSTVQTELHAMRIEYLARDGRPNEALTEAEAFLGTGATLRRLQVQRMAADLALAMHGCERALPHLRALAEQSPTEENLARLDACERLAEEP